MIFLLTVSHGDRSKPPAHTEPKSLRDNTNANPADAETTAPQEKTQAKLLEPQSGGNQQLKVGFHSPSKWNPPDDWQIPKPAAPAVEAPGTQMSSGDLHLRPSTHSGNNSLRKRSDTPVPPLSSNLGSQATPLVTPLCIHPPSSGQQTRHPSGTSITFTR